ncbi:hypothetical protein WG66_010339 [Moniliophthora roreri]|nr:hypothetical protein WG66_010339 [Moniliophthora roreri]
MLSTMSVNAANTPTTPISNMSTQMPSERRSNKSNPMSCMIKLTLSLVPSYVHISVALHGIWFDTHPL